MADNGTRQIATTVISSVVSSAIVALVAYYGISSSVAGSVNIRLQTIEYEMTRFRDALEAQNSKRVYDLEAEVIVLKDRIQRLQDEARNRR